MYIIEVAELPQQLALLDHYDQISNPLLTNGMLTATRLVRDSAAANAPSFSGELAGSMSSRVTSDRSVVIGEVYSSASNPIYPLVMEYGRTPGKKPPPTSAIVVWVEAVLGDASLAYVVARSIGRKGIKGKHFLKRAWDEHRPAVLGMFKLIADQIADRLSIGG